MAVTYEELKTYFGCICRTHDKAGPKERGRGGSPGRSHDKFRLRLDKEVSITVDEKTRLLGYWLNEPVVRMDPDNIGGYKVSPFMEIRDGWVVSFDDLEFIKNEKTGGRILRLTTEAKEIYQ